MKKEIGNIALKAVNKFIYFALNYESNQSVYVLGKTYYVPKFLTDINWGCATSHMVGKWVELVCKQESGDIDSYGIMLRFYTSLDNDCKVKFLNWILDHYKGELRLTTNEEV